MYSILHMEPNQTLLIANHPVSEYLFPNGLRLLVCRKTSSPVVGILRAIMAGSNDEPNAHIGRGVAHFIEHMDFRFSPKTWDLEKKYGDEINAATNPDATTYHIVGHKNHLEEIIQDDFERYQNKKVDPQWLKTEMSAVLNEEDRGNDGPGVMWRTVPATVFQECHYAMDTIGTREDIQHASADDMTRFRELFYVPNNTTIVVAGDVNTQHVVELVSQRYGSLPRGADVVHSNPTDMPQAGQKRVDLIRPAPCTMICLAYPGPHALTQSSAIASVVQKIWEMRAENYVKAGTLHSTGMYAPRMRDAFMMVLHASLPGKNTSNDVIDTLQHDIHNFQPTAQEIERAKKYIQTSHKESFSSVMNIIQTLGNAVGIGDWRDVQIHAQAVQQVRQEDVQQFCKEFFHPERCSAVRLIPGDMPTNPTIIPRNIQLTETKMDTAETNTTVRAMKNEGKVAVHYPDAHANYMHVSISVPHEKQAVANILAGCMGNGCKLKDNVYSQEQCDVELSKRETIRSFSAERGFIHAAVRLPTNETDKLTGASIVITGEVFAPEIDFDTFNMVKKNTVQELLASKDDPNTTAKHILMQQMFSTSPYISIDEQVQHVNAVSMQNIHAMKNSLRSHVAAITYSRDAGADSLDKFVARIQTTTPYEPLTWIPRPVEHNEHVQATPGHASNVFMVGQTTNIAYDDPKIYALRAAVHILGGGMSARLMNTIRGKMGLGTYGIYASMQRSPNHPCFIVVSGTFAPDAAEAGAEKTIAMITDWANNGITQEELDNWKTSHDGPRAITLDNVQQIVSVHHSTNLIGKEPQEEWDAFEQRVQNVSLEQVNALLREHIQPTKLSIVKMGNWMSADDLSDDE